MDPVQLIKFLALYIIEVTKGVLYVQFNIGGNSITYISVIKQWTDYVQIKHVLCYNYQNGHLLTLDGAPLSTDRPILKSSIYWCVLKHKFKIEQNVSNMNKTPSSHPHLFPNLLTNCKYLLHANRIGTYLRDFQ